MYRGRKLLQAFVLLGVAFSLSVSEDAFAQTARKRTRVRRKAPVTKQAPPASSTPPPLEQPSSRGEAASNVASRPAPATHAFTSNFAIGASFQMFNEVMLIGKGDNSEKGVGDYAGVAVQAEQMWKRGRREYGTSIGLAAGKASAGGFGPSVSFPEAINRSWWAAQWTAFADYRVNPVFSAGLGLFARYRVADWGSDDPALEVTPMTGTQASPLIHFRWQVTPRILLSETFVPLNFEGATFWQWSAQIVL